MDQATAGLVGAIIGAGSAVTTQVIAATFTQRAVTKRLTWEQHQARSREAFEHSERFTEVKRALFADYLTLHTTCRDRLMKFYPWGPAGTEAEMLTWMASQDEAGLRLWREILLVAPMLGSVCDAVTTAQRDAFLAHAKGMTGLPERHPAITAYAEASAACAAAMAVHLDASSLMHYGFPSPPATD